jgi:hypothetical protein
VNVNTSTSNATRLLAGVVFVVTIVAYVYLVAGGHDTVGLIALTGPVLGALFVVDSLGRQNRKIAEQVEEVKQQTNGVLDERIHTQVARTIAETLPQVLSTAYATQPSADQAPPVTPPSTATLPPGFAGNGESYPARHGAAQ